MVSWIIGLSHSLSTVFSADSISGCGRRRRCGGCGAVPGLVLVWSAAAVQCRWSIAEGSGEQEYAAPTLVMSKNRTAKMAPNPFILWMLAHVMQVYFRTASSVGPRLVPGLRPLQSALFSGSMFARWVVSVLRHVTDHCGYWLCGCHRCRGVRCAAVADIQADGWARPVEVQLLQLRCMPRASSPQETCRPRHAQQSRAVDLKGHAHGAVLLCTCCLGQRGALAFNSRRISFVPIFRTSRRLRG